MTVTEQIITVAMAVLGTMITRFLPFAVFPAGKPTPAVVRYLGNVLPGAVFSLLVIYCLRNVDLAAPAHGAPELIAVAATVGLHLWKRQMLISIFGGTAIYMLLVQLVFV